MIDSVYDGFKICNIADGEHIRTLCTRRATITNPKVVKFCDGSRMVVGGSDHGLVYIFDTSTGKVLDKLQHALNGPSEIIAVRALL